MKVKPQLPYVACRRPVVLLQSDRDVRIGGPADAAIAVAQIYARYGQADVVDNPLKFVRRDLAVLSWLPPGRQGWPFLQHAFP